MAVQRGERGEGDGACLGVPKKYCNVPRTVSPTCKIFFHVVWKQWHACTKELLIGHEYMTRIAGTALNGITREPSYPHPFYPPLHTCVAFPSPVHTSLLQRRSGLDIYLFHVSCIWRARCDRVVIRRFSGNGYPLPRALYLSRLLGTYGIL